VQLLRADIPKVQKDSQVTSVFFAFGIFESKSCGKIDTWGRFCQHFTSSFYTQRFQKHKSRQFHQHFTPIFLYEILAPKITKPNVIREKLLNSLSYKKLELKILMNLTPG